MRLFINFFFLFASFGCNSDKKSTDNGWDVIIKGKVNYPQSGTIQIQELKNGGGGAVEQIELNKDNTYSKTLHLKEPGIYGINFFGKQAVNLMVDHSTIELNVDGNNQQGMAEIKGSPDHELYNKVQTMYQGLQEAPALKVIEADFQKAAAANDEKKINELRAAYMKELENGQNQIVEFLKQQPPSLALYHILQDPNLIDKDKNIDLFTSTVEKFKKSWPSYHYTQELVSVLEKMKVTAIGQVAPEIALANPDGQIVKLSSLRGKYVLIDFWAKWCGPCRKENPNVVKAYHRFKEKGFEVYSVSLDRNKADWLQAIKEDGLTWTHVSDLKYFECQAARDYNINAIPFSILLDKNGVILAKNLRGAALEQKLEEVLGKM
ncbi:MAG TPA: TlpA disulfide reductase family protein [Cyclobacteriaceae bacterium]|jgi:peroxiredoxin|nr:TlpA disulfide reductase family protein [Cyclobacteriaceae bacterium]